jgi:hypothetical protein
MRPDGLEADIERRVAGRVQRQKLLHEETPPQYWAVIDEAVLWRTVGGRDVMREQLEHLGELIKLPCVTLQVVPFEAGEHAGMEGAFLILGFPEQADPDVVYVEYTTAGVYLEQESDVARYTVMFDHLRAAALRPEETAVRLNQMAERLRAGH